VVDCDRLYCARRCREPTIDHVKVAKSPNSQPWCRRTWAFFAAGFERKCCRRFVIKKNPRPAAFPCRRCSVLAGYSGRGEASVPPSTSRPPRTARIINSVDGGASVPNLRTARFCLCSRESWRFCCSYTSGRQFSPAIYVVIGSWNVPRQAADLSTDPFHCGFARAACQFRRPMHLAGNTDAVRTLLAGAASYAAIS
jgi:hypothetical protein